MKPLANHDRFIIEEIGSDVIIYDRNTKKAHSLNRSVAWIWRKCDGQTDTEELSRLFQIEFDCGDSEDLVLTGIHRLREAGLLETEDELPLQELAGAGISRRSALMSGSALVPLVATILVPPAHAAKSGDTGKGDKDKDKDKGDKRNKKVN